MCSLKFCLFIAFLLSNSQQYSATIASHPNFSAMNSALSFSVPSQPSNKTTDDPIAHLIPALTQCFGLVTFGYLAGRFSFLTDHEAQGISFYVTKFALPVAFFRALSTIDFDQVLWSLVAAVSCGKLIGFALAFLLVILLTRPNFNFGLAAIVAMFVSQSNDIALAYPVLRSLYPDLADYIYLFAPAQLVFLNPLAYFSLEWHRSTTSSGDENSTIAPVSIYRRLLRTIIIFYAEMQEFDNPFFNLQPGSPKFIVVVFPCLLQLLQAQSFTATALITLGFGMAGNKNKTTVNQMFIILAILFGRLIFMPFVTQGLVIYSTSGLVDANSTIRLSTFGFLYGSIPTAPPVYLFAAEYSIMPGVFASGLVIATFISGPILFILARAMAVFTSESAHYGKLLLETVNSVAWFSLTGCVLTFIVLLVTRNAYRVPHRFTMAYLASVLLTSIGIIGRYYVLLPHAESFYAEGEASPKGIIVKPMPGVQEDPDLGEGENWASQALFSCFFLGCMAARFWTSLIASVMLFKRRLGLCYVLRNQGWIYFAGLILPLFATSLVLLIASRGGTGIDDHISSVGQSNHHHSVSPIFCFGDVQLIVSLIVLSSNLLATLILIVTYLRIQPRRRQREESVLSPSPTPGDNSRLSNTSSGDYHHEGSGEGDSMTSPLMLTNNSSPSPINGVSNQLMEHEANSGESTLTDRGRHQHLLTSTMNGNHLGRVEGTSGDEQLLPECGHADHERCLYGKDSHVNAFFFNPTIDYSLYRNYLAHISTNYTRRRNLDNSDSTSSQPTNYSVIGNGDVVRNSNSQDQENRLGRDASTTSFDPNISNESRDMRHLLFLMLLILTSFFGICHCLWRLVRAPHTAIYLVLEFIDGIMIVGQGVILFALFGLDMDLIVKPIQRLLSGVFARVRGSITLFSDSSYYIGPLQQWRSAQLVRQFKRYHLDSCKVALPNACPRRTTAGQAPSFLVFTLTSLWQYLLDAGLVQSRQEAERYSLALLRGRLIEPYPNDDDRRRPRGRSSLVIASDPDQLMRFVVAVEADNEIGENVVNHNNP